MYKGYKQPLFALDPIIHTFAISYRCNYTDTLFRMNIVFNETIYIFNLRTTIKLDIKTCSYKELQEILPFLNKLSEKNLEENSIFS